MSEQAEQTESISLTISEGNGILQSIEGGFKLQGVNSIAQAQLLLSMNNKLNEAFKKE